MIGDCLRRKLLLWVGVLFVALPPVFGHTAEADERSPEQFSSFKWTNAPWSDPKFFPIAVWLQSPANAERYRQAGINTYVGLWKGPTEAQLAALGKAGMYVICDQNEVALRHLDNPSIIAWMHGDEPDNAQSLGEGRGWGPPIPPATIVEDYHRMRAADPTRPVLLNLGQGVAWDGWYGRGVRSNHPEDYPEYLKGCDIASFDIYPAAHDRKEVASNLWFVARGVERLINWTDGRKPVWNCIECTHIGNPNRKATPHEVRAEVWMSLIHGSRGLIYFVHQFKPKFIEAALLADPEMLSAVTAINRQIKELAPVLNSPTVPNAVRVNSTNAAVPVADMVKRYEGATYLFAVGMRHGETSATFKLDGISAEAIVEVLGEDRTLLAKDGSFTDRFAPWDVHLYSVGSWISR
ncbi:MAG: hypothetical protein KIS67_21995 [Verrucomicrobiae bacterium]|nr:hypothetical protein [Verrucomicrobiae bacterium]